MLSRRKAKVGLRLRAGNTARIHPGDAKKARNRAVFLDRDGVLNDLEYNPAEGNVGSPLSASQLRVTPHAGEAVRKIRELGYKAILISNQPTVAKKQLTYSEFERMNRKVRRALAKEGGVLDGEYYCLHHPDALVAKYKADCDCRKPKPGLIIRAANENSVDLSKSYFVGDALPDVKAGHAAGCKTILLGHMTAFLAKMIDLEGAEPDYVLTSVTKVPELLERLSTG